MTKRVCDECKKNEAIVGYKIKRRINSWGYNRWTCYEKIDLCDDCRAKILGVMKFFERPPEEE